MKRKGFYYVSDKKTTNRYFVIASNKKEAIRKVRDMNNRHYKTSQYKGDGFHMYDYCAVNITSMKKEMIVENNDIEIG